MGHGLGAPHLYIFGALLEWAASQTEQTKDLYTKYESLDLLGRNELVKLCKIAKLYDPETKKLVISFGTGPEALQLRGLVMPVLTKTPEAQVKVGKPPPGYMERELGDWLTHPMN